MNSSPKFSLIRTSTLCACLSLFASTLAFGQTTVTTTPVGVMTYTIAAGTGSARNTTSFSIPLSDTPGAQGITKGVISARTATSVTVANAGWIAGALSSSTAPYQLRMTSGGAAGAFLSITANTTDTLTVSGYDLSALAAVGDGFELIPVDTLGTLFGSTTATLTLIGGTSSANADIVYLGKSTPTGYYFNTTTSKWVLTVGPTIDKTNTQIPFSGTITVSRLAAATTQLSSIGNVPAVQYRTQVSNAGTTYTQSGFPSDTTLGGLAIQSKVAGWVKGSVSTADIIAVPAGAGWNSYYHNGTNWVLTTGPAISKDTVSIPAGSAIRITKRGSATGSIDFINPLPYTL